MDSNNPRKLPISPKREAIINATSSKTVEGLALSGFKVLKYFIIFFNEVNDITKEMEFTVKKSGSQVVSTVTNRIGIGIDLAIDAQVNGADFEMFVTNNENYNLKMSYTRIKL